MAGSRQMDQGDGVDRRGFLECMAWAGTGLVWSLRGGVLRSAPLGAAGRAGLAADDFVFAQISDSHIGFAKDANPNVVATLEEALRRIKTLAAAPDFLIHTGDLTHLSTPAQFDTVSQVIGAAGLGETFYVPGEHDVIADDGKEYLSRHGQASPGRGWFSFDHKGVHFVGLVNVLDLKPGGLGNLGAAQLAWLRQDLGARSASTPIVVFAHMPLWSVYPDWGWGTADAAEALTALKKFGSVTVLNGHIHQTLQKIEGQVHFHTAASTAFPQPAPGAAASPGPMTVPADQLRRLLGLTDVRFVRGTQALAIVDHALADAAGAGEAQVTIDNFQFTPPRLSVAVGTTVRWINRDDVPHTVTSPEKRFASAALDTDDAFTHTFEAAGSFEYYCTLHPRMVGRVVVGGL